MANNSDYRAYIGHDVALGSLGVITPQPTSEGVQHTRRSYAVGNAIYDEAPYVELVWSMVETPTQLGLILAVFGLNGTPITKYNDVTVYVRNEIYIFQRYNGVAVFPEIGRDVKWNNFFPRNLTILVKDLVEL